MGQVLHGCATTTEAVRRAIQHSQESLMVLAARYGINPTCSPLGERIEARDPLPWRAFASRSERLSLARGRWRCRLPHLDVYG